MGIISDIPRLIIEQGNAIAQGQREQGRIWGATLAQLGELPGQVMAQTLALKRAQREEDRQKLEAQVTQQNLQMGGLQLAAAQRADASRKVMDAAFRDPANRNPDGSLNDDAVAKVLLDSGDVGASQAWQKTRQENAEHALKMRTQIADINEKETNTQKAAQAIAEQQNGYVSRAAYNFQQDLAQHSNDLMRAQNGFLATVADLNDQGLIPAQRAHEILIQGAQASPQDLSNFAGRFVSPDMRAKLDKEAADTAKARADAAKAAMEAAGGKPRALQQAAMELPGKGVVQGTFDPETGRYFYNNEDVTAQAKHYERPITVGAGAGAEPLSDDAIDIAGARYRLLGTLPTRFDQGQKAKIMNAGARQAKALGDSPAGVITRQMMTKADSGALANIQKMASSADAFETKANAQAELIRRLSQEVPRTQWPVINQVLQAGRTEIAGDPKASQLAQAVQSFTMEYAKILEGSTGSVAASTKGANDAANRMLNPAMNKGTIEGMLNQMQWEMRQTGVGYDAAKQHILERMGGTPSAGTTPVATSVPAASVIPPNVGAALRGQKPGKYTLSDGSVWVVMPDGTFRSGK